MYELNVPGYKTFRLEHIVFDFNGTLAEGGQLINGLKDRLCALSSNLKVHIVTADTFNTVRQEFSNTDIHIEIIDKKSRGIDYKKDFIKKLGKNMVIAIGNGNNDAKMLNTAELGVAVIGKEGAAVSSILNSDIIVNDIKDVFNIIDNPQKLIATLRR